MPKPPRNASLLPKRHILKQRTQQVKRGHIKMPKRFHSETEISSDDDCRVIKKKKVLKSVAPKYQQLPKTYPQDKGNQEKPRSPNLFSEASLAHCKLCHHPIKTTAQKSCRSYKSSARTSKTSSHCREDCWLL